MRFVNVDLFDYEDDINCIEFIVVQLIVLTVICGVFAPFESAHIRIKFL